MAKIIKKHWDITLIGGIGLVMAILGILTLIGGVPGPSEVSAATSANVTVSATVAQSESLVVASTTIGASVNGASTTVATGNATVPLGTLSTAANTVAAHTLTMTTNASGGYTVNTKYDHVLQSGASTTKDINDWTGTNSDPTTISGVGVELFGYTTEDYSLGTATTTRFSGGKWAKFTTGDLEAAYNGGPVSATTTKIGYQAGISGLTPAATDYGCTVTYTMTSAF